MLNKGNRVISMLLVIIVLLTCVFSATLTAFATTSEAGHVVYFDNSITNYPIVYAYMWKDGSGENASWPGELMTNISGDIWAYNIKGSYDKIIFTQGDSSGQSDDLDYAGNNMIAVPNDNGRFKVTWSAYTGDVTLPTTATQPTSATESTSTEATTPSSSGNYVVYMQNDAKWSKVNAYMWNTDADTIGDWPGVAMTDLGDGLYEYTYTKSYANIIFNDGSTQTGNLTILGNSYLYNNSTGKWVAYTPSAIKIKNFDTSYASPCYTSCSIKLTAEATSNEGELTYTFTATGSQGADVLYKGSSPSVIWVPTYAGDYKLKVEVTDKAGNSNYREISYVIKDATTLETAFIRAFSNTLGTKTQIKLNTAISFTMDAIGGNVGNNKLFYKFLITDPMGNKNIAYYTTSPVYTYIPESLGEYKIAVSVQNSNNKTLTNTYTYQCVSNIDEEFDGDETIEIGDANRDGVVDVRDVTTIQKYLAKLIVINTDYCDVNGDGKISIRDATAIQLKLANIK